MSILINLVCGLVASMIVVDLVRLNARAPRVRAGWVHLRPSALHWTALALGLVLIGLFGWIWLFVGSSRTDGAEQMRILGWLLLAFSVGTLLAIWQVRRVLKFAIRFRGQRVVFRQDQGGEREIDFQEIASARLSLLRGYTIKLKSGKIIFVDPYATGAAKLVKRIDQFLALSK
ncbi:hypothetical protein [Parasphingorhabdus halotolerans]|uniref:Uncharacterized protein n=1 Tax=Parasphingorhabdus halotolerans TaxID=2725558 RepID=A0A6H2DKP6_9SPHN|nr:hypothetical protein [Parasphingorhabdus halotolerans]QJB68321.1 hypothetical protein HF685_02550 [Parasphingorhabdus halotolerans]